MTALDAYLEGIFCGRFTSNGRNDEVTFTYAEGAPSNPISLSLPRNGGATRRAAANFLDNLLPDRIETRRRMAATYGATGTDSLSLLAVAGGDVAGGLVLVPEGTDIRQDRPILDPALDYDVAERIAAIKRDPDAWTPNDGVARFSLAGSQGKFALARVGADWYWPNRTLPSTHILKPATPRLPGLEAVESDTLRFAAAIGVPAASAEILQAVDQQTFVVERFDRAPTSGVAARRIHVEDLAQAGGIASKRKYHQTAKQAIDLLRSISPTGVGIEYDFLRQLMFNTLIGNADAHAKNYSVMLRPGGISLAPLYDPVPVLLYSEYDQQLAMSIAGARRSRAASRDHWRKFAASAGLDVNRVEHDLLTLVGRMEALLDEAWPQVDARQRSELANRVRHNLSAATRGERRGPWSTGRS